MKKAISNIISILVLILIVLASTTIVERTYKEDIIEKTKATTNGIYNPTAPTAGNTALNTITPPLTQQYFATCTNEQKQFRNWILDTGETCSDGYFNMPNDSYPLPSTLRIQDGGTVTVYKSDGTKEYCTASCTDCANNGLINLTNCPLNTNYTYRLPYAYGGSHCPFWCR